MPFLIYPIKVMNDNKIEISNSKTNNNFSNIERPKVTISLLNEDIIFMQTEIDYEIIGKKHCKIN